MLCFLFQHIYFPSSSKTQPDDNDPHLHIFALEINLKFTTTLQILKSHFNHMQINCIDLPSSWNNRIERP